MMNEKKYCYKTTLKNVYGLTESWIKRLGEPDKVVPNPHRRSTNSYLYLRERVEMFIEENRESYERLQETRAKRSKAATAVAEKKRQETLDVVNSASFKVYRLPSTFKKLYNDTLKSGRTFLLMRGRNTFDPDEDFTMSPNAITAHVRHLYTNYEQLLTVIEGRIGKIDAYLLIRDRVNELVSSALTQHYGEEWLEFCKENKL